MKIFVTRKCETYDTYTIDLNDENLESLKEYATDEYGYDGEITIEGITRAAQEKPCNILSEDDEALKGLIFEWLMENGELYEKELGDEEYTMSVN